MLQTLFASLGVAAGLASVAVGLWVLRKSAATTCWLPVTAIVLRSHVVSDDGGYAPLVSYRYSMDGVEYESSRVRLVRRSSAFKGPAEAVVRRYPEASAVVAHVNPTDHREAVLEAGAQPFAALLFVVGGLLMIIVGVLRLLALADAAE